MTIFTGSTSLYLGEILIDKSTLSGRAISWVAPDNHMVVGEYKDESGHVRNYSCPTSIRVNFVQMIANESEETLP